MNHCFTVLIVCCFYISAIGQTRFHEDSEKVFEKVSVLISKNELEQAEGLLQPIKTRLMSKSISNSIWDYFTFSQLTGHELHIASLEEDYERAVVISRTAKEKIKPGIRSDDQIAIGYYSQCINEQLYSQMAENYSLPSLESAKLNLKIVQGKVKTHRFQFPSTKANVLKMFDYQMNQIDVRLDAFQE